MLKAKPSSLNSLGNTAIYSTVGILVTAMIAIGYYYYKVDAPESSMYMKMAQESAYISQNIDLLTLEINRLDENKADLLYSEAEHYLFNNVEEVSDILWGMSNAFNPDVFRVTYTTNQYVENKVMDGMYVLTVDFNLFNKKDSSANVLNTFNKGMNLIHLLPKKHLVQSIDIDARGDHINNIQLRMRFWTSFKG